MGAQELHLKSAPDEPGDRAGGEKAYRVAGESMEFFLRTGDELRVRMPASKEDLAVAAGDLVLCMGAKGAPILLAHRAVAVSGSGAGLRVRTKGDFHFLPDPASGREAVIGRVELILRGGRALKLDGAPARAMGAALALYSFFGAVLYRLAQGALYLAARTLLGRVTPRTLARIETGHLAVVRRALRWAPGLLFEFWSRPAPGHLASETIPAGGEISGDAQWSGEIRVSGDVVVLPGATLTVNAGTRAVFQGPKRFHHGVRRFVAGEPRELVNPDLPHLIVYGRLLVRGEPGRHAVFEGGGAPWGGVVLLGGDGVHELAGGALKDAAAGLRVLDGARAVLKAFRFVGGEDASLCARSGARVACRGVRFQGGALGARAEEDSVLSARACVFEGARTALCASGRARLRVEEAAISGPGTGMREGIRLEGEARARLVAASVSGYPVGLLLRGTAAAAAASSRFEKNSLGIFLEESSRLRLSVCVVSGSRTHGLWAKDRAAVFASRTLIAQNAQNGAFLTARARLLASNCTVAYNGTGIFVSERGRAKALECRFSGNRAAQLAGESGRLEAVRSRFRGGRSGLLLTGDARASLRDCSLRSASDAAAALHERAYAELSECALQDCGTGLSAAGGSRTRVTRATVAGCRGHGLWARQNAEVFLSDAVLSGNAGNGAFAEDDSNLILENCRVPGNACGLSARGRSRTECRKTEFSGSRSIEASFEGGEHRLSDCRFEGGIVGAAVSGTARVSLARSELSGQTSDGVRVSGKGALSGEALDIKDCENGLSAGGESRTLVTGASVAGCRGHGLWVRENAAVFFSDAVLSGNAGNGAFAEDESNLILENCRVPGNACGLSARGRSRTECRKTEFSGNRSIELSVSGGNHRLEGCSLDSGAAGAGVLGDARVRFSGGTCSGHSGPGIAVSQKGSAASDGLVIARNAAGAVLSDDAVFEVQGGGVEASAAHGFEVRDRARLRLDGARVDGSGAAGVYLEGDAIGDFHQAVFERNLCGLSAHGESRTETVSSRFAGNAEIGASLHGGKHALRDCSFESSPRGLGLAGTAEADLSDSKLRGHSDCGLSAGDSSRASLRSCVLESNGTGAVISESARLDLSGGWVRDNAAEGVRLRGRGEAHAAEAEVSANRGSGFLAEEESRVELAGGAVRRNGGHGLWLNGRARAGLASAAVLSNAENGIFAEADAVVRLHGARIKGGRCGIAAAGRARVYARRVEFSSAGTTALSLMDRVRCSIAGGSVSGSRAGLVLNGSARARLEGVRFSACETGAVLTGGTGAVFRGVRWAGCDNGLWAQENSKARLAGGAFATCSAEALRASQNASAEAAGTRFSRNCMGVFAEDAASVILSGCAFRLNPTGVKADGGSSAALRSCRLRGCVLDGFWLGERARGDAADCGFFGNRIGFHHHWKTTPRLAANIYLKNAYGDIRRFPEEEIPR